MPIPMLFLPPQSDKTREWAKAVADACPELEIIIPETREGAEQAIALAEGAFGTIPAEMLPRAGHLRWLQAPQAAPPAGYYYPELIAHPVQITNFREIYNDHIAAHIMSFVLAFARGLQRALPVNARFAPEAGPVPGYPEPVVMSSGAFVNGATIELSCDAPLRPPFEVYLQGGTLREQVALGALLAADAVLKESKSPSPEK